MSWKFILYDWYGLNVALFQAINAGTPATLGPLAWFFSLVGNYWTAPLMLLGLWWWSKSAANPGCADAVRHRLIVFGAAFLLALLAATVLKLWLDLSPSRGFDTSARARFTNKACRINSYRRALAFDGSPWPRRLGALCRLGWMVAHCCWNALPG